MEPTTIMMAISAISAVSSMMKGSAQSSASTYNADIATQNAQISRDQGTASAAAQDKSARLQIGQMIANFGASGVSSGQGSAMDVLQDSVRTAKLDNLTILHNAELRATGFSNSAGLDKMNASSATTSGLLGAAGAVASGYGKYEQMQYPGTKIPGVSSGTTGTQYEQWD